MRPVAPVRAARASLRWPPVANAIPAFGGPRRWLLRRARDNTCAIGKNLELAVITGRHGRSLIGRAVRSTVCVRGPPRYPNAAGLAAESPRKRCRGFPFCGGPRWQSPRAASRRGRRCSARRTMGINEAAQRATRKLGVSSGLMCLRIFWRLQLAGVQLRRRRSIGCPIRRDNPGRPDLCRRTITLPCGFAWAARRLRVRHILPRGSAGCLRVSGRAAEDSREQYGGDALHVRASV
jgi:hypothetical protein